MLSDLCPDLSSGSPAGKFEHAFGLGFFFFFFFFPPLARSHFILGLGEMEVV